tara:strand:- start:432 stop:743 length:312 start_codon:yes stop_codon:yes gene_type:complete
MNFLHEEVAPYFKTLEEEKYKAIQTLHNSDLPKDRIQLYELLIDRHYRLGGDWIIDIFKSRYPLNHDLTRDEECYHANIGYRMLHNSLINTVITMKDLSTKKE